jgi:hypothetical protein
LNLLVQLILYFVIALFIVGAVLFVVIDMISRVDLIKERVPWLEAILQKRSAFGGLLLAAIFLELFLGYELYTKDMPTVPAAPVMVIKAPGAPKLDAEVNCPPSLPKTHVRPNLRNNPPVPATPAPEPQLADIRIASQKQIVSTNPKLSYGLEVVLQTNHTISPVAFLFEFDGDVGEVRADVGSGSYLKTDSGAPVGRNDQYVVEWESPPFAPESPMTVHVFSKTYVRMIGFRQIDYRWPLSRR